MTEPSKRVFSEQEVALILRRAAQLQQESALEYSLEEGSTGFNLVDIERAAQEAGIDPRYVRQGAAELNAPEPVPLPKNSVWGAPLKLRLEYTLEGELPDNELTTLRQCLEDHFGKKGRSTLKNRSLSWKLGSANGGDRIVNITVAIRRNKTIFRLEENLGNWAGGIFGGFGGGVGGGVAPAAMILGIEALGSPWTGLILAGGVLAGTYYTARAWYRQMAQSRYEDLHGLLNDLLLEISG